MTTDSESISSQDFLAHLLLSLFTSISFSRFQEYLQILSRPSSFPHHFSQASRRPPSRRLSSKSAHSACYSYETNFNSDKGIPGFILFFFSLTLSSIAVVQQGYVK